MPVSVGFLGAGLVAGKAFRAVEVLRVLRTGDGFITQQIDVRTFDDFYTALEDLAVDSHQTGRSDRRRRRSVGGRFGLLRIARTGSTGSSAKSA